LDIFEKYGIILSSTGYVTDVFVEEKKRKRERNKNEKNTLEMV